MASHIVDLLQVTSSKALKSVVYLTCMAGVANVVLISLINLAAQEIATGRAVPARVRLLYLIGFAIFFLTNRQSLSMANQFLQRRLGELRLRIADSLRNARLRTIEQLGSGELHATLANESDQLTQNFTLLVAAAQSLFLLLFCLLYIAYLSVAAFLVIGLSTSAALWFFWRRRKALDQALLQVYWQEAAMLDSLQHFSHGFQEIRLNAAKNDALYRRFDGIVNQLERTVVGVGSGWVVLLMFGNAFLYALLGVVVFVLPGFFAGYPEIVYKIAAAAFFCVGPVTTITAAAPFYTRANAELGHIVALEQRLRGSEPDLRSDSEAADLRGFRHIDLRGFRHIDLRQLVFTYNDSPSTSETAFVTGPLDLRVTRGELIFIRGGNGSGKSTLMKLLCGLYQPSQGVIEVDGKALDEGSLQSYRELFSCIFPDFHLFDRLHSLEQVDPAQVQALITRMELDGKVQLVQQGFSTLDLSTGQRKRLAMIVSLLEDRELYLFDEWAADQDQHFREVFYRDILPDLQRRGKTVIAVTHDEQYWHLCDRLITLDLGRVSADQAGFTPSSHTV